MTPPFTFHFSLDMSFTAAKSALLYTSRSTSIHTFSASTEKVWKVYLSGEL